MREKHRTEYDPRNAFERAIIEWACLLPMGESPVAKIQSRTRPQRGDLTQGRAPARGARAGSVGSAGNQPRTQAQTKGAAGNKHHARPQHFRE